MTPYRLLALDIDGTLLRSDKTVSPRTVQALSAAQRAGVRIVLVTTANGGGRDEILRLTPT